MIGVAPHQDHIGTDPRRGGDRRHARSRADDRRRGEVGLDEVERMMI